MADPEFLGFEHMGLDPRLLQVRWRAGDPRIRLKGPEGTLLPSASHFSVSLRPSPTWDGRDLH